MLREPDGAIRWQFILDQFTGFDTIIGWSFGDRRKSLGHGSNKVRLECCIDNLGNPKNLPAIQGPLQWSNIGRIGAK